MHHRGYEVGEMMGGPSNRAGGGNGPLGIGVTSIRVGGLNPTPGDVPGGQTTVVGGWLMDDKALLIHGDGPLLGRGSDGGHGMNGSSMAVDREESPSSSASTGGGEGGAQVRLSSARLHFFTMCSLEYIGSLLPIKRTPTNLRDGRFEGTFRHCGHSDPALRAHRTKCRREGRMKVPEKLGEIRASRK